MKIRSDGKQMLQFWLALSELFAWLIIYQFLMYIGFLGILVCVAMLCLKWYAIIAEKRDVYHKYKRHRKASISLMVCLTVPALVLKMGNAAGCVYALMLFMAYYLTSTYALNLYEWVIRWGDLAGADREIQPQLYVQLENTPEMLEAANRKFIIRCLIPALFGTGAAAYVLWVSPIFNWIRGILMAIFARFMLFASSSVYQFFPEIKEDPSARGMIKAPEANPVEKYFTETLTNKHTFELSYTVVGYCLIILLIAGVGISVYKVYQRKQNKNFGGNLKSGKGQNGVIDKLEDSIVQLFQQSRKSGRRAQSSEILRYKYTRLLKRLEKQGWTINKTDTATEVRVKLNQLYPGQEAAVDLITEAYCERRYGERDPANIEAVLQAFELLEGIKNKDSRIEGGVS